MEKMGTLHTPSITSVNKIFRSALFRTTPNTGYKFFAVCAKAITSHTLLWILDTRATNILYSKGDS